MHEMIFDRRPRYVTISGSKEKNPMKQELGELLKLVEARNDPSLRELVEEIVKRVVDRTVDACARSQVARMRILDEREIGAQEELVTEEEKTVLRNAVVKDGSFTEDDLNAAAVKAVSWAEGVRVDAILLNLILAGRVRFGFKGEVCEPCFFAVEVASG